MLGKHSILSVLHLKHSDTMDGRPHSGWFVLSPLLPRALQQGLRLLMDGPGIFEVRHASGHMADGLEKRHIMNLLGVDWGTRHAVQVQCLLCLVEGRFLNSPPLAYKTAPICRNSCHELSSHKNGIGAFSVFGQYMKLSSSWKSMS